MFGVAERRVGTVRLEACWWLNNHLSVYHCSPCVSPGGLPFGCDSAILAGSILRWDRSVLSSLGQKLNFGWQVTTFGTIQQLVITTQMQLLKEVFEFSERVAPSNPVRKIMLLHKSSQVFFSRIRFRWWINVSCGVSGFHLSPMNPLTMLISRHYAIVLKVEVMEMLAAEVSWHSMQCWHLQVSRLSIVQQSTQLQITISTRFLSVHKHCCAFQGVSAD